MHTSQTLKKVTEKADSTKKSKLTLLKSYTPPFKPKEKVEMTKEFDEKRLSGG